MQVKALCLIVYFMKYIVDDTFFFIILSNLIHEKNPY